MEKERLAEVLSVKAECVDRNNHRWLVTVSYRGGVSDSFPAISSHVDIFANDLRLTYGVEPEIIDHAYELL